jgi:hypothetical protein
MTQGLYNVTEKKQTYIGSRKNTPTCTTGFLGIIFFNFYKIYVSETTATMI